MITMINAKSHVGTGFPPQEGAKLASILMTDLEKHGPLTVDLRSCSPALLISAFFNGFLQKIHDDRPELLETARQTKWLLAHEFQKENVATWMKDFKPQTRSSQSRAEVRTWISQAGSSIAVTGGVARMRGRTTSR